LPHWRNSLTSATQPDKIALSPRKKIELAIIIFFDALLVMMLFLDVLYFSSFSLDRGIVWSIILIATQVFIFVYVYAMLSGKWEE
jgi:hypothetical protein